MCGNKWTQTDSYRLENGTQKMYLKMLQNNRMKLVDKLEIWPLRAHKHPEREEFLISKYLV